MLSSEGKPSDTKTIGQQVSDTGINVTWEHELEYERVFQLIENILSFEACLYYQVVPFGLEDNKILLGIVNPEDKAALDYVHRILSYMNYTIVSEVVTGETHRSILSAYLNYKNTLNSTDQSIPQSCPNPLQDTSVTHDGEAAANPIHIPLSSTSPTEFSPTSLSETSSTSPHHPSVSTQSSFDEEQEEDRHLAVFPNVHLLRLPVPQSLSSVEILPTLPPKKLLAELLGRVISGGIGRLYLERQPYHGRILWSENGVVQSVLDKLPLSLFQGVLNELKRFASLPVTTTLAEPRQVEKECLYQRDRLLLRLRVMPGMYGEEATLQVLRGAALKFYQKQQLARLSRDALGISQQLNYKLHELRQRLILNRHLSREQQDTFSALSGLLRNLDFQIKRLTDSSEELM